MITGLYEQISLGAGQEIKSMLFENYGINQDQKIKVIPQKLLNLQKKECGHTRR